MRKIFWRFSNHSYQPTEVDTEKTDGLIAQAEALNRSLFSDVESIPSEEWKKVEKQVADFCDRRQFLPDYKAAWVRSQHRLYLTIKWLEKLIPPAATNMTGLEMGGESPATDLLNYYFPNLQWRCTTGDLRYPWKEESNSVDILVCTELLEHVSDLPEGFSDSFLGTGMKAVLGESFRVLKPGGRMLVTTPNSASILHLKSALFGYTPWFFTKHVREYTIDELTALIQEAGLQVVESRSIHCMTYDYYVNYTGEFKMLLENGYNTANRGDDIFLIARKP